jgi:hypothetical protein
MRVRDDALHGDDEKYKRGEQEKRHPPSPILVNEKPSYVKYETGSNYMERRIKKYICPKHAHRQELEQENSERHEVGGSEYFG